MAALQIAIGLALLLGGGEALVKGGVATAQRFGIPPLVIGLTLVGFGTSTPELVTSLQAALAGSSGIAIGNVVGSNIANILLILGSAALILPFAVQPAAFRRDGTVLVGVGLLVLAAVLTGTIGRAAGLGLLALLCGYTAYTIWTERRAPDCPSAQVRAAGADGAAPRRPMSLVVALPLALGGIAAVVFGANQLVTGAVTIATAFGVPEAVIGLTLVALGTSLPELATSTVAALRGQNEVAFGNVMGSNIFNGLGILGAAAVAAPLEVPQQIAHFDVWAMLAATLLLVLFAMTGWRVGRREGAALLVAYLAYLAVQFLPSPQAALALG